MSDTTIASTTIPPGPIAGFWPRGLAFLIDLIVVGTIGEIVGFAFREPLENIHAWQRLVGFLIAATYFIPLDSRFGHGQTLGKRLMKVAVVGRDGEFIGVGRASLRFSVLAVPIFANGIDFARDPGRLVDALLAFVVFGLGLSLAYLYGANRRTRQSLHDLASDTFVCRAAVVGSHLHARVSRGHLVVVGVICLVSLILGLSGSNLIGGEAKARLDDMGRVRAAALTVPGTWSASVMELTSSFHPTSGPAVTSHFLVVSVRVDAHAGDDKAVAQAIAQKVLETAPDLLGQPSLRITILHGIDLGIASATRGYSDTEDASTWRARQDPAL